MTGALSPGFLFNSVNLGNANNGNPNTVGGQGLSNFGVGRSNNDLGFGGLVLSASSENISVLIRALAARRNVQVLSRPQIRTLDNQEASIQVGQQVPIVGGVNVTQLGNANPLIEQQDVGLILTVRPRINPDGTIVMETAAVKSQLDGAGVPVFINDDGSTIESPIIDITSANTTVSVPNGHTIVMGGIITESDETIERKVPWLGDVPIVGRAFRFDSTNSTRSELLIFLTPRVILNDADSEFIKQVETERTHMIEEQAEEVHGPIFGVPPTMNGMQPMQGPVQLPDGSFINPASFESSSRGVPNQSDLNTYRRTPGVRPASGTSNKEEKPSGVRRLWPFR
jgi:type II secretory pathway component GspD/PulD (secretin)